MKHLSLQSWCTLVLLLIFMVLLPTGCSFQRTGAEKNGLFSWDDDVLREEQREELFAIMKKQNLGAIYQYGSRDTDPEKMAEFFAGAREHGIEPFLLIGEPEWAADAEGTKLCAEVRYASMLKECEGLVIDVEPYLLPEWNADREALAETFVAALIRAKGEAEKSGLKVIVCIPYWLDEKIGESLMEELVRDGCDMLAVMNYYRKNESEHLKEEAALCREFRKPLINIYELQEPGKYGLQPINTYYSDGLPALAESWEVIAEEYREVGVSYALHTYKEVKAFLQNE